MRVRIPFMAASAAGLGALLIAAAPAPLTNFTIETSLKDSDSGAIFARQSYNAQSKVLENTHKLAVEVYEDLRELGGGGCQLEKCEVPGPIKLRLPRICFGIRAHGELVDHGPIRENVNLIENKYTDSLTEVVIDGPIEGGPIELRGGPPEAVLEIICGGHLEHFHSPDVNANVQAGPSCIEHGGSPDAKALRVDSGGFWFTPGGCTDN